MSWGLLGYFLADFSTRWHAPPDDIARAVRVVGLVLLALALAPGPTTRAWRALLRVRRAYFLGAVAIAAALGSYWYLHAYLRGGPRIIDSTTYLLQAKSLSQGHFTWPLDEPSASYRGRFLYAHDGHIGGIFPPGYPLVLAVGVVLGAPLLVGPVTGGALAAATYALTRELAQGMRMASAEPAARIAALFSIASFALRYHTADTMSHGTVALAVSGALAFTLRARRTNDARATVLAGACIGYVLCTRLVSVVPVGVTCALVALFGARSVRGASRTAAAMIVGAVPGVLLLLLSQYAITGHATLSTQLAYYARSDGPPGCFRYGFGPGIGCLFEHGDFVRARLPQGHTFAAALETNVWRLKAHMIDPFNVEILAVLLVPFAVGRALLRGPTRWALLLLALHYCVYLPFYFDGSYPGGGARFFADVIPLEHALVALALASARAPVRAMQAGAVVVGLGLLGFAYRGAKEHVAMRERDGGRPAFEPHVVERVTNEALLFVDSDAAFALAFEPRATLASGRVAAHFRGDAHDWFLWKRLGSPPSYHYLFGDKQASFEPYTPSIPTRFEAERDWPPVDQAKGFATPYWPACASDQSALALVPASTLPTPEAEARAVVEVPVLVSGVYRITPRIVDRGQRAHGELHLRAPDGAELYVWSWDDGREERCDALDGVTLSLRAGAYALEMRARGGEVALDATDVEVARALPAD